MAICERCKREIEEERRNGPNPYAPYAERIRKRVRIDESVGLLVDTPAGPKWSLCWLWEGGKNGEGYGGIRALGKPETVHRVIYMAAYGKTDLQVNHQCDNKLCVNPRHLKAGTQLDNMRELTERKPGIRGVRYGKLSEKAPTFDDIDALLPENLIWPAEHIIDREPDNGTPKT